MVADKVESLHAFYFIFCGLLLEFDVGEGLFEIGVPFLLESLG